jgi:hypothetical protein
VNHPTRPTTSKLRFGRYLRPLGPLVAFGAVAVLASRLTSTTIIAGVVLGVVIVAAVIVVAVARDRRDTP